MQTNSILALKQIAALSIDYLIVRTSWLLYTFFAPEPPIQIEIPLVSAGFIIVWLLIPTLTKQTLGERILLLYPTRFEKITPYVVKFVLVFSPWLLSRLLAESTHIGATVLTTVLLVLFFIHVLITFIHPQKVHLYYYSLAGFSIK
ncbi:hypothetical protein FLK61_38095 [Paenalkalicoccus suaedae]|uniref:RDD domain-containing protein n=1 Tax=Paenalkalicoccus suaedae TaxID=2592382 RepID=A0A859FGF1_9BACI|nr:hypothetical protein [Paenalkalicoccus suaedae]QKS72443.1 hypothetical protein FLK61_38095 [Paenalkalicoccus suaedae]